MYFSTAEADPHRILAPKATHPPTAVDILSAILRRDGAQVSAHSAAAAETDPSADCTPRPRCTSTRSPAAAETHSPGQRHMARIDAAATAITPTLTDCEAWPVLRRNLALLSIDGHDPVDALRRAAQTPLDNVIDAAAVLDWRLQAPPGSAAARVGPLRWLPSIPNALATHPRWGSYLTARAGLVTGLASEIRAATTEWTTSTAPQWARPLAEQPQLRAEIAVFRAAHDVDPADTRITGPAQHANRSAAVQQLIRARLGDSRTRGEPSTRWRTLAHDDRPAPDRRPVLAAAGRQAR